MQSRVLSVLLSIAWLSGCEPRVEISGIATVVDGDSLRIGATSIRLHAVDAPEYDQQCRRGNRVWACGVAASDKLEELAESRVVTCTKTDTDDYGRTVAICRSDSVDLGAEMVLLGLALAYRQYGNDYVAEEAQAMAARRGVWAGEFVAPWDWRRNPQYYSDDELPIDDLPDDAAGAPSSASRPADPGCLIKGNINSNGERIYHMPGWSSYEQTIIDEARGERWFCTEQEALDAGWRAPRR